MDWISIKVHQHTNLTRCIKLRLLYQSGVRTCYGCQKKYVPKARKYSSSCTIAKRVRLDELRSKSWWRTLTPEEQIELTKLDAIKFPKASSERW